MPDNVSAEGSKRSQMGFNRLRADYVSKFKKPLVFSVQEGLFRLLPGIESNIGLQAYSDFENLLS